MSNFWRIFFFVEEFTIPEMMQTNFSAISGYFGYLVRFGHFMVTCIERTQSGGFVFGRNRPVYGLVSVIVDN